MKKIKKYSLCFNFLCFLSILSIARSGSDVNQKEHVILCEDVKNPGYIESPTFTKNPKAVIKIGDSFAVKIHPSSLLGSEDRANKMCEKAQGKSTFFVYAIPFCAETIEEVIHKDLMEKTRGKKVSVVNWDAKFCFSEGSNLIKVSCSS